MTDIDSIPAQLAAVGGEQAALGSSYRKRYGECLKK